MPLPLNPWKHYSSPLKLKEYLALGLPIVSTDFPEARYYRDVLYVAHTPDEFIHGIGEALAGRGNGTLNSRTSRVAGDTWEQIAVRLAERVQELSASGDNHSSSTAVHSMLPIELRPRS